jgi:hypothetical protein
MTKPLNQLWSFLAGYFHEDWRLEASSDREIVSRFRSSNATDEVTAVREDLASLLGAGLSEDELRHLILDEWMVCYDPSLEGRLMSEWLGDLLNQMSR